MEHRKKSSISWDRSPRPKIGSITISVWTQPQKILSQALDASAPTSLTPRILPIYILEKKIQACVASIESIFRAVNSVDYVIGH